MKIGRSLAFVVLIGIAFTTVRADDNHSNSIPNYSKAIFACVRSHLAFSVLEGVAATAFAEFAIELLPDGRQSEPPRLVKPSAVSGYDIAAMRAILLCDPFPRRDDGSVPRSISLRLYPVDR